MRQKSEAKRIKRKTIRDNPQCVISAAQEVYYIAVLYYAILNIDIQYYTIIVGGSSSLLVFGIDESLHTNNQLYLCASFGMNPFDRIE